MRLLSSFRARENTRGQSNTMYARVRSSMPHSKVTSSRTKSSLKRRVYSAVKAWPTARRRAVQKKEREGSAFPVATHKWVVVSIRGFEGELVGRRCARSGVPLPRPLFVRVRS